jgi:hypothetical protein
VDHLPELASLSIGKNMLQCFPLRVGKPLPRLLTGTGLHRSHFVTLYMKIIKNVNKNPERCDCLKFLNPLGGEVRTIEDAACSVPVHLVTP